VQQRRDFHELCCALLAQTAAPVSAADKWQKFPCETLIEWMSSWTADLIRLHSAPRCATLDNGDFRESLQAAARELNLIALFGFLDHLNSAQRALKGQANRQLTLEELLIGWSRLAGRNP
jgi:DNA polymerase III subunit delta'